MICRELFYKQIFRRLQAFLNCLYKFTYNNFFSMTRFSHFYSSLEIINSDLSLIPYIVFYYDFIVI